MNSYNTHETPLTELQIKLLADIREKPQRTTEDYVEKYGYSTEAYKAMAGLIFQQHVRVNEMTGAITAREAK